MSLRAQCFPTFGAYGVPLVNHDGASVTLYAPGAVTTAQLRDANGIQYRVYNDGVQARDTRGVVVADSKFQDITLPMWVTTPGQIEPGATLPQPLLIPGFGANVTLNNVITNCDGATLVFRRGGVVEIGDTEGLVYSIHPDGFIEVFSADDQYATVIADSAHDKITLPRWDTVNGSYSAATGAIPTDYAEALETVAPGVTAIVADQMGANEAWHDTLTRIVPDLEATPEQKNVLTSQAEHAAQGLPATPVAPAAKPEFGKLIAGIGTAVTLLNLIG